MATIETRTGKDGDRQYRVKVRLRGHPSASATFDRITDAKRWAADTETAIRAGRYVQQAEAKRHTVADLVDRYIAETFPRALMRSKRERALLLSRWKDLRAPIQSLVDAPRPDHRVDQTIPKEIR